jgi:signal transduction histidine kinase
MGLLVALALAAAFVAILAVVLWLPPRPPDVMRADDVAGHFEAGYAHMREQGAPIRDDAMSWSLRSGSPRDSGAPHMRMTRQRLAERLRLSVDSVRISATQIVRNDVFVFRVRDAPTDTRVRDQVVIDLAQAPEAPVSGHVRQFDVRTPPPLPAELAEALHAPTPPDPPAPPMFAPAPPGVLLLSGFEIGAQLPDGRWLVMRQGRNWAELGWIARAALVIGGALATLSLLALLFARRLTRPIRNFADAVQAVGVDPQSAPVLEEGPRELRGAARAVNTMQARLRALIADRTKTLAAVAHDMRTPLMRLRLVAEKVAPEQRERMAKEIGEVEALVASFIAFARDDPAEEARVRLDLSALLQSLADDHAEGGRSVSFESEERVIITAQSLGLKRLFANLIDNALKYANSARVRMRREGGEIVVDVEDDGPGVPLDQREVVFEPFVRLNEEMGGAGLGLPAARSIARAHGGDIVILNAGPGAVLRVNLPG